MLQNSRPYLHIPITGPDAATLNASMLSVSFASPVTGPWYPADGYTYDPVRKVGTVKILVGPGSTVGQFALGVVQAYIQVTAAPTQPVFPAEPGPYITAT